MAKRLSDTDTWKKQWFRMLSPEYKCFWNYILSNCNHSGIWDVDFELATFQIGADINIEKAEKLFQNQILKLPGKWFIKDFIKFQYGEALNEKSPVHKKVIDSLKSIKYKNHTLYDTLYHRVLDTGKEKEEDKEEEKEEEKEKEIRQEKDFEILEMQESEVLQEGPTFEDFWDDYDKKVGERGKIKKKWIALSLKEREAIMEYIPNYKASQPDKQYRKNPETFLNNKSWNDELIFENGRKQQNTGIEKATKWAMHFAKGTSPSH